MAGFKAEASSARPDRETQRFPVLEVINRGLMSAGDLARFASTPSGARLDAAFERPHLAPTPSTTSWMLKHQSSPSAAAATAWFWPLADLSNLRILDEIRFQTGLAVDPVVVEAPKLIALVERLRKRFDGAIRISPAKNSTWICWARTAWRIRPPIEERSSDVGTAPVVRLSRSC